jgi:tetratricopeptide (TPR) repeat protein
MKATSTTIRLFAMPVPVVLLFSWIMLAAPLRSAAQDPPPNPPDPSSSPAKKQDAKPKTDSATNNAPDQPMYDPLRAEKDLEVGKYYMHKGDLDAAIDRFQDATTAKPGYALPFRLLAEAQEKKGLRKQAIKSYTRYLDLYPHAEDADKIHKKIDKLYAEVQKEKKQ